MMVNSWYFFKIVNDQPSTTISWVADKILTKKITNDIIFGFGFPDSGNQLSMLLAK